MHNYVLKRNALHELKKMLISNDQRVNNLNKKKIEIIAKSDELEASCAKFEQNLIKSSRKSKKCLFEEENLKKSGQYGIKNCSVLNNNKSSRLIKTFQEHSKWVNCIEQIEDFSKILTASGDNSIKVWSTESGKCLKTLTGHINWVETLIISNDKKYLISGSWDKTIKVWSIEKDFECVQTLQQEYPNSLCLLPNNILVCGLLNGTITKWNLNNFIKISSFKAHESYIWGLKHVSSSQIFSCSDDKTIKLWNLETNECLKTFIGHTNQVNCLEISSDKSTIYSGSCDRTLRVWDISSGECRKTIGLNGDIYSLKLLSPITLAVGLDVTNENALQVINLNSNKIETSIKTESEDVRSLNFNSKTKNLFTGSKNGTLQMWQL